MADAIAVLGAGNMGTALAQVLATNGHHVRAWSVEHDVLSEIRDRRVNTKYLDGVKLHDNIEPVWDLPAAVKGVKLAVISVPSQVVRGMAHELAPLIGAGQLILNVAKGLESGSNKRLMEVIGEELGDHRGEIGAMGGPAIAVEMARGLPLAVIIGMPDAGGRSACQEYLQNAHLKVATTEDVCGLELCATLKNVYAIALGICDGLGYGANTKAFVASLALEEVRQIVESLGGGDETAFGLAGIGDLLTTGYSPHSRNRTLGEKLGSGGDWEHFLRTHTVEGVGACRAIVELTTDRGLNLPLLVMVNAILHEGRPAPEGMRRFFDEFAY